MADWLALCIGNSRYHWGWFGGDDLVEVRDSDRLEVDGGEGRGEEELISAIPWRKLANRENPPLICLASVVPQQTQLWRKYPNLREITLKDIPLKGLYPTMGIDRALAVFGASQLYGAPVLVIDTGTALTFTGVNAELELVGGAILPGLKLQFQSLANSTGALPQVNIPDTLPNRWAKDTTQAIQSGIMHTVLAGIQDFVESWQAEFGGSKIIITGGDRSIIYKILYSQNFLSLHSFANDSSLVILGFKNLANNNQLRV